MLMCDFGDENISLEISDSRDFLCTWDKTLIFLSVGKLAVNSNPSFRIPTGLGIANILKLKVISCFL